MAMRRPRVKMAANLAIRRPSKQQVSIESGDTKPAVTTPSDTKIACEKQEQDTESDKNVSPNTLLSESKGDQLNLLGETVASSPVIAEPAFKFPKPIPEPQKIITPAPTAPQSPLEINVEEPHSPKKDSKFAFINALSSPRKRIRTESMTSNKSFSDISLKSRKAVKQEESQKAFDAKREIRKRLNNIQNIDKQSLTMFDMIYYNPAKNPMKSPALSKKGSLENIPSTVERSRSVSKSRSPTPVPTIMPPPSVPKAPPQLTPQLKLGPNGEMILDEASLVIENEREKEIRDTLARTEIVYDDEFSGNSGYYSRYKRTRDWPPEETIRFYRCLHTVGTDFSMMIQLFPNRSRRDLKLKFKKEERLNLMLVNKALLYPKEFNIEELKQQFQEEDEANERQREFNRQLKEEAQEKLREQKIAKRVQLNQSKQRNPKKRISKSARVMLDGGEQIAKAVKEVKPRRKRRKMDKKGLASCQREDLQKEEPEERSQNVHNQDAVVPSSEGENLVDESARKEVNRDSTPMVDDSSSVSGNELSENSCDVPYIPNGDFTRFSQRDDADTSDSVQFNLSKLKSSESNRNREGNTPINAVVGIADDSPLDIESMSIDVVDSECRSLYEIKPEPKAFPVPVCQQTMVENTRVNNVITLENLDDHSQTTLAYQSSTELIGTELDYGVDSAESKYYGRCNVYMPIQDNVPVAYPVKSESYNSPVLHPVMPPSNPPHTVHASDSEGSPPQTTSTISSLQDIEAPSKHEPDYNFADVQRNEALEGGSDNCCDASSDTQGTSKEPHASQPNTNEDDEREGSGSLEDIDINSLVLVESQDTNNPERTIYEIYVIDSETGKLSDKPLDVPEDMIENIRSILETGED